MEINSFPSRRKPHKNPETCKCFSCASRRRKAEAIALGTRREKPPKKERVKKEVINADAIPVGEVMVTAGNSPRHRIAQWIALRLENPGIKNNEAARLMGVSHDNLRHIIYRATRDGWLKFDDPIARIENEIIPKVLDNLSSFLDKKDKTVTIETAKGTVFKDYEKTKGLLEPSQTLLAIKIEAPDPSEVKVLTGAIIGAPRTLEE